MLTARQREIVIEFEKVQTIRKRAKTTLTACPGCGAESDTVLLGDAAELFETSRDELFRFIEQNDCHYHVSIDEKIYLCVRSLLESMQQQAAERNLLNEGEQA
jgi:hypothetical protein